MVVSQRMHLDTGKRNCKVYKYSDSSNSKSFNNVSRSCQECKQLSNFLMAFSCDICDREFTEKHSLTRHMKNQQGNLWSCHRCNQSHNRHNYEMHQRVCLFKATGTSSRRLVGHSGGFSAKKTYTFQTINIEACCERLTRTLPSLGIG